MQTARKERSLPHAIEVLKGAAKDSTTEIRNVVSRDFRQAKDSISGAAKQVDESVKSNAWWYLGAAAVLGFIFGRRKK